VEPNIPHDPKGLAAPREGSSLPSRDGDAPITVWERTAPCRKCPLCVEDWRLLGELQEVLRPIHDLTLQAEGSGGALWMGLTQMEYLLNRFEDLKSQYDSVTYENVRDSVTAGHNLPLGPTLNPPSNSTLSTAARRHREQANRRARANGAASRFNERALPGHIRASYMDLLGPDHAGMGISQQDCMRVLIRGFFGLTVEAAGQGIQQSFLSFLGYVIRKTAGTSALDSLAVVPGDTSATTRGHARRAASH
jgi:hypothetical protein